MGVAYSGYVKAGDYTKNSDGTFTCKINCIEDQSKPTVASVKTLKCIGAFNVNSFKSPNRPNQMMILSSDNKYIFLQTYENNKIHPFDYVIIYYVSVAIVNYNITIPDVNNYNYFMGNASAFPEPTNDNTYNSLPKGNRKAYYKFYLMGQNPPSVLFTVNPDAKVWKDIGYIFKAIYDQNVPDEGLAPVPPSYCIKIDSPTIITDVSEYDCRAKPNASPTITKSLSSFLSLDLDASSYGMIGVVVSVICCLLCTCGCVLMIMIASKSKRRKK
jgi:hypothetical protein